MVLMREQLEKKPFINRIGRTAPISYPECILDLESKMCLEVGTSHVAIVRIRGIEDIPFSFQQYSVEGIIRYLQKILIQEEENYHKQVFLYEGKIHQEYKGNKKRYILDITEHSRIGIGYDSVGYPGDFGVYLLLLDISLRPEVVQEIKQKNWFIEW